MPNQAETLEGLLNADELFAALPTPALFITQDGTILHANPSAQQQLDLPHATASSFYDLLDSGSYAKAAMLIEQGRPGPTSVFELNMLGPEDTSYAMGWQAAPFNTYLLLLGQKSDRLTQVSREALQLSQRLRRLFIIAASVIVQMGLPDMFDHVLELTLQEAGARAGAMFAGHDQKLTMLAHHGWSEQWINAQQYTARLHPWERDELNNGKLLEREGRLEELGFQATDLLSPLSVWGHVLALPMSYNGEVMGWLYLLSDMYRPFTQSDYSMLTTICAMLGSILHNQQLTAHLAQRSQQLQRVLDLIESGIVLLDAQDTIQFASQALANLISTPPKELSGQQFDQTPLGQLQPLGNDPMLGELLEVPGIPRRIIQHQVEVMHTADQEYAGSVHSYRDVTQLQMISQLKDEFMAAAAHDLKTPVTAIKGYTQIAMRFAQRAQDQRLLSQLEIINIRTNDLVYLMDSLLDMSRLQAGTFLLDRTIFPLTQAINAAIEYFRLDMQRQQRTLEWTAPSEEALVDGDRMRLERVVVNLISNALKYSPDGSPVRITLRFDDPAWIELQVTDYGLGIAADERERIWERFYRISETVRLGFKGTGIGLYIVHSIIQEHGGHVEAKDADHGQQGTTICVRLPRFQPAPE